jgi:hypothetical protein
VQRNNIVRTIALPATLLAGLAASPAMATASADEPVNPDVTPIL